MLLQLRGIEKRFEGRADLAVLRGVDLDVDAGESVAIVGSSGCGKSTLLNVCGGLIAPSAGEVRFDGEDVARLDGARLARFRNERVGIVFQQHHLLPQCTALENVLVPTLVADAASRRSAEDRARSLLDAVGLSDRADHRPARLSGGECQRVAVARALIREPALVLADEPTGSLDGDSAERVADLLFRLVADRGAALLLVTHDDGLAARAGRSLRLRDGRLEGEAVRGGAAAGRSEPGSREPR
jgi:lipoprotein-releasing system ATP-binding protein